MNDVLGIILGGGQGARLFPLTQTRSKPAVPIGGKYRLIDIPISNCLHADLRRIFVLTQFNSASLNRHIAQSYHMDPFSRGFVDILAAEQTPDNPHWFQGTADAVRQASRHFADYQAAYYLILAGDHLYRMDYGRLLDAHVYQEADITIAALPVTPGEATSMGLFLFDRDGHIVGFEEKPDADRLERLGSSVPAGSSFYNRAHDAEKPFIASMGIYVFSRDVLHDILEHTEGTDFGREIIPASLGAHTVKAFLHDGYWADVGTVESFYDANILLTRPHAPFTFYDPRQPIFTHERYLPPSLLRSCTVRESIVADGCFLDECAIEGSVIGIRTRVGRGTRITRSVLLGADSYLGVPAPRIGGGERRAEAAPDGTASPDDTHGPGIGCDVVLDRVIIDKNATIGDGARLVNEAGVTHANGEGYYIRGGIVIVPKGGIVAPGSLI
ncbi:MAG TPA: glucose-1-phosphate adenylyltransferase [Vicinamibacterales bacterium]|jgi:glucose-1-phosphate adenylyltransferase|nr:glucose-1-phosphate adenylyltransferase [Vicinamibacterales bacterium]